MAPELVRRQPTDQRIDVYSFSVTCYEMWTRRFPWESGTSEAVMQRVNQPPEDIRDHAEGIDDEVAEIIMRGLATRPDDRWQSMTKMLDALNEAYNRLNPGSPRTAST